MAQDLDFTQPKPEDFDLWSYEGETRTVVVRKRMMTVLEQILEIPVEAPDSWALDEVHQQGDDEFWDEAKYVTLVEPYIVDSPPGIATPFTINLDDLPL